MGKISKSKENLISDNDVIDLVTRVLYSDTSREFDFENDILKKTKLKYTNSDISRVWELLLASNMVDQSIGFGKAGKIELSSYGLIIMNKYGNYINFLNENAGNTSTTTVNDLTPEVPGPVVKSRKTSVRKAKKKTS